VVARVLAGFVSDASLVKVVAERPMAPVQVVVVLGSASSRIPDSFRRLSRRSCTLTTGSKLSLSPSVDEVSNWLSPAPALAPVHASVGRLKEEEEVLAPHPNGKRGHHGL
jgi:hypothetical protein